MKKTSKLIAIIAIAVITVASIFALCSCEGLFGGGGGLGGGGGNKQAKLTAEYDNRYEVYVGDSLDSVKQHITVTYTNKDGGTQTVSDFDLTGTIAEGECTLTVSYEGLTATVKVTVIVNPNPLNLGFELLKDSDSYSLTNVPSSVSDLVIPSTYKDKPVTSISSNVFRFGNGSITSITIPASVNKIDSMCSSVETVYYDGTVADWCAIQFKGGENITNPMAHASDFYIKSNGEYAKLTSVVIPDGVETINNYQFYGLADITSVSIPNSVTSVGDYAFYNCENITSLTLGNKVEEIGDRAFYPSKNLTSLIIPDSVTEIGDAAFYNCENLTKLTLGAKLTNISQSAFYNCSSLTSVSIPDSVEVIRPYAFGNGALTSLTVGKGVKHVYEFAFNNCTALESIYYNGTIADWCGIGFERYTTGWNVSNPMYYASKFYIKNSDNDGYSQLTDIVIPDGVTKIGEYQFYYCGELNSITIPNSVVTVGNYAFSGCTFLTSATIPYVAVSQITAPTMVITNGTEIRAEAFKNRKTITSITLPNSLTSISWRAFESCTGLTSIEIPENVTSIDYNAFYACTNLKSVTLNSKLTSIGNGVFYNCDKIESVYYNGTLSDWCGITFARSDSSPVYLGGKFYIKDTHSSEYAELTDLVIPQDITSVGEYQFRNFAVTSVEFHDKIKEIKDYAFSSCKGITSINLPQSLTSIGNAAFNGCKGITSLIIPDSVTEIGEYAFSGCSNLASVSLPDTIKQVGRSAFDGLASSAYTEEKVSSATVRYLGNENNPHMLLISVPYNLYSASFVIHESTKIIIDRAFDDTLSMRSITIPISVKYIGEFAFPYQLNNVYYNGTIADWCDIYLKSSVFDNTTATYHFYIKNADNNNYTEATNLVIPEGVTSIGKYQFARFNNVNSVSLPESLTYIGESAFFKCVKIESVVIPDSVTEIAKNAFESCSALVNVNLGNGVRIIGDSAFKGCSALASMQAPESLESLGNSVFADCSEDFFNVYDNASYWGNDSNPYWILIKATSDTTAIHEDTKVIASRAFSGTTIRSIAIPDSVENIGESAFQSCKYLTSITIGSGVKYIGTNAFYMSDSIKNIYYNGTIADWCNMELNSKIFGSSTATNRFYLKNNDGEGYTEVTELVIPDGVENIQTNRFYAFNNITSITIGKDVKSMGRYAFDFCKNVYYIYFEGTIEEWKAIDKGSWISTDMHARSVSCSDGSTGLYTSNS